MASTETAQPLSFRAAFCRRRRCPESAFEHRLFWFALYRHALPLAILIRWLWPGFFRADTTLIERIGGALTLADVEEDLESFTYANRVQPHWLRTGCRIRVRSSRIRALARECLPR